MARLAEQTEVAARVVVEHQRQMDRAFVVLLDGIDDGGLAGEEQIHGVTAARARAKPDARAGRQLDALVGHHGLLRFALPTRATPIRSWRALGDLPQPAYGSVQSGPMLRRQSFGPVENLPGAIVGLAGLALLLVGHRQDAQRQDLVDLSAVEEITVALRGDLRDSRKE